MRSTSEAAQPDQCVISRPGVGGTTDPVTLVYTPNPATVVYTGGLRLRAPTAEEFEKVFGETQVTETRYIATLPATGPVLLIGDTIAVTTSSDPRITAEVRFRITRVPLGSWLIDRRVGVEVVD